MKARRALVRLLPILTVFMALTACQRPATPLQPAAPAQDPVALARDAFDRRDWAIAAPLLRNALQRTTGSLELHYKLAITASHLSLIDEGVREFEWVVAHAAEASEEMRIAREWLAAAKAREDASPISSESRRPTIAPPASEGDVGESRLSGTVTWTGPGGGREIKRRLQVHLIALPGQQSVEEQRFTIRTGEDGRYVFAKIPPGVYKLTNTVAGAPLWRLRVTISPGRETTLDLNNANSVSVRDDFPERS